MKGHFQNMIRFSCLYVNNKNQSWRNYQVNYSRTYVPKRIAISHYDTKEVAAKLRVCFTRNFFMCNLTDVLYNCLLHTYHSDLNNKHIQQDIENEFAPLRSNAHSRVVYRG